MKLCSACLLGIRCRYDGKGKANRKIVKLLKKEILIPVCPEQLGGLSTPRKFSEQRGDRVITEAGRDVTGNFEKGAKEVLKLARLFGAQEAVLKQKSPSCGCGKIPDGSFTGRTIKGDGVTAALLKKNGIKVLTEDDF